MGRRLRAVLLTPVGVAAACILALTAFLVVFAPAVWGHDATANDVSERLRGVSADHPLGTDALGRDLLARLLVATRPSILLSALAVGVAAVIGIPLGAVPVLLGRRAQRLAGAAIALAVAFPAVLLAIFTDVVVGVGARGAVVGIGVASAPLFARLSQTLTASVAASDYVAASRLLGVRRGRLLARHVLPNIAEPLVLNVTISLGAALLALSALSFLGLGVQSPGYDWGRLLNEGLPRIYETPAYALGPAAAIVLAGIGFSLAGEVAARYVSAEEVRAAPPPGARATAPAAVAGDEDILRVRDLSVTLRAGPGLVRPVRGVSFTVGRGEIVGIVGESGSGKTLTALAVADLLPPSGRADAAELTFLGRPVRDLRRGERARLLGTSLALVYQNPMSSMNPVLRVGRQLGEVAEVHTGLSRVDARRRAVDRLRAVGIPNPARRARQYPHELSGGMRQRAMIAMGLMGAPRLIIADEPTTALDVTVQRQVLALLREVSSTTGAGILFISHDLAVVSQLCDRVLVMYAGRIVEELDTDTLRRAPAHPYTRALLGSLPSMTSDRHRDLETIPGRPPDPAGLPAGCPYAPRCRYATPRSREEEPVLTELPGPAHRVSCFQPVTAPLDPRV